MRRVRYFIPFFEKTALVLTRSQYDSIILPRRTDNSELKKGMVPMGKNTAFSEKHPELWKLIKFNISVFVTSALDIISYLFLLYFVLRGINRVPLSDNAILSLLGIKYKGYLFAYLISTSIGYAAAYLINRRIGKRELNSSRLTFEKFRYILSYHL